MAISQVEKYTLLKKVVDVLLNGDAHPRLQILHMIMENPNVTREEISRELSITPQTVSVHLKVLEKEGFIRIRKDDSDLRRKVYTPTEVAPEVIRIIDRASTEIKESLEKRKLVIRKQLSDLNNKEKALQIRIERLRRRGRDKEAERLSRQLEKIREKRARLLRKSLKYGL